MIKRIALTLALVLAASSHAQGTSYYGILSKLEWVNLKKAPTPQELEGRVILLDFWTYCCVNCLHVIPDLHRLEQEFGDKLMVLGIHSAKFDNEKDSANILQAIDRYGIHHPVANDSSFTLWQAAGVNAWPTFILLGSNGRVVDQLGGEGVYVKLRDSIAAEIAKAEKEKTLKRNTLQVQTASVGTPLRYPGKLIVDAATKRLFVSDSEHQRIRVLDLEGKELETYGSGAQGLKDGPAAEAQFHSPQGLALRGDKLYVADTDNHALRVIDLKKKSVRTIAGTGRQSRANYFVTSLKNELSTPWDLAWRGDELVIAMAGTHQLYKMARSEDLSRWFGTGEESITDGSVNNATLSQPSGLVTASDGTLYFVDSETSSLREIKSTHIATLVGTGLFDFGFRDGLRFDHKKKAQALMQHPLGVAWAPGHVYIADTYNHAIRDYDIATQRLTTLFGGKSGDQDGAFARARLREPAGLAVLGDKLFIADTNNHKIKVADLSKKTVTTLNVSLLEGKAPASRFLPNLKPEQSVERDTQGFSLAWKLPAGMKLNSKAPSQASFYDQAGKKLASYDLRPLMAGELKIPSEFFAQTEQIDATLYYCKADNTGACLIESLRLKLRGKNGGVKRYEWRPAAAGA